LSSVAQISWKMILVLSILLLMRFGTLVNLVIVVRYLFAVWYCGELVEKALVYGSVMVWRKGKWMNWLKWLVYWIICVVWIWYFYRSAIFFIRKM